MDENPYKAPVDAPESAALEAAAPRQNKRPSPLWWLLVLPIVDLAGLLAISYGAAPLMFGAIFIFLLGRWLLRTRT